MRRPSAIVYSSTNSRTVRFFTESFSSAGMSISTLKWPVLATMVPSCMTSKCSPRSTWMSPVAVTNSLATLAASATGMTRKPSMTASRARSGSTSSTIDVGAVALHAHREAAAAPAVAGDAHGAAGDEDVGGADHAVERALAGAVAVVEHVLGVGLVDGHDGEHEPALGLERLEADDAGRGLLGAADDVGGHVGALAVEHADDVGAVVHGDVGAVVDAGVDVRVVRLVVLALDGVDAHAVLLDERRGHVVLRAQRIAGAEHDVGAAGDQRAHEAGRLGGDVQAGADAHARRAASPSRSARGWPGARACACRPTRCAARPRGRGRCL